MASINSHVEGLTGDLPAEVGAAHLSNFIKTALKEVISGILKFNPEAGILFATESDSQVEQSFKVNSGLIYSVMREDGNFERWRPCRLVDVEKEYLVTDTDSMFYASVYNPVYIRKQDNTVNVYPAPSGEIDDSNGLGGNAYRVMYIEYPIYDNDLSEISSGTDMDDVGIQNFPKAFHPHLYYNIAIKCLKYKQHQLLQEDEDIELSNSYDKAIAELEAFYQQLFITKDIIGASLGVGQAPQRQAQQ
tara:strand:+ start:1230 stop:1970 length:741 start_codon:yes stop_codon:yes gene_type:complete